MPTLDYPDKPFLRGELRMTVVKVMDNQASGAMIYKNAIRIP